MDEGSAVVRKVPVETNGHAGNLTDPVHNQNNIICEKFLGRGGLYLAWDFLRKSELCYFNVFLIAGATGGEMRSTE